MLRPVEAFPPQAQMRRTSATQFHTVHSFPAPTLGVDSRQSLAASNPQTAITIENMFARSFGLELRAGYSRWSGIAPGANGVTLMPYQAANSTVDSRLFMAANDGNVYDVTDNIPGNAASVLTVAGQTNPGEVYWVNFVLAGGNYLIAVFPGAGLWTYESVAGWTQIVEGTTPGTIEGIDPAKFGYVLNWENRLWFIETDTGVAWFLPVKQFAGKAEFFDFGPMFTHGGYLAVGASWTVDGGGDGGGMADSLVMISSEGDVLIYGGEDPTDPTKFHINGRWFVGRLPVGRRCITRNGTDMAVLCERGVLLMTEILRNIDEQPQNQACKRINQLLQPDVRSSIEKKFWEIKLLTDVNCLVVNSPVRHFNTDYVWTIDLTAYGASKMTNMPFTSMEMFHGKSFAADDKGNVWKLWSGNSDGAVGTVRGLDIQATVQAAFVPLGDPFCWKRFLMVRAGFRSTTAPAVQLAVNSEWTFAPPSLSPVFTQGSGDLWDVGVWTVAQWSGSTQTYKAWVGAQGMGHYAAIAMRVRGDPGTVFTDWDCVVEQGGIL